MTDRIAPGTSPGGLVFQIRSHDGTVLSTRALTADAGDLIEAIAAAQADLATEHTAPGQPAYLHVFDGDTGECITTGIVSTDERR